MRTPRFFFIGVLIATVLTGFTSKLSAQVKVDLSFKRSLYLKYEPILATVTIENLTGRELYLSDSEGNNWFGFEIISTSGRLAPPINPDYHLDPVQLGPGQTLNRMINITPLYALGEYGSYRVRANVYLADTQKFFSSQQKIIDITQGRLLWQQTVGVPEGMEGAGTTRVISLLSHRLSRSTRLYLQIQDPDKGIVYATHQLGKYVTFGAPNIELDDQNNIHVLQNAAPKQFIYTKVDLNGKVLDRKEYSETVTPPALRKKGGQIVVVGGEMMQSVAGQAGGSPGNSTSPSLSDRPVPLPKD